MEDGQALGQKHLLDKTINKRQQYVQKMTVHLVSVTVEELSIPINKYKFIGNVVIFTPVLLPVLGLRLEGWMGIVKDIRSQTTGQWSQPGRGGSIMTEPTLSSSVVRTRSSVLPERG